MKTLRTKQLYLPDTNILLTRFLSSDGVAELTDFMPVTAGDRSSPYAHQVIRMLRVVRGEIPFRLLCAPRFNYARVAHTVCQEGDSLCFRPECGDCPSMSLHASVPLRIDGLDGRAEFSLAAGQSAVFAFGNVPDAEKASVNLLDQQSIEHQFAETTKFWRAWISQ